MKAEDNLMNTIPDKIMDLLMDAPSTVSELATSLNLPTAQAIPTVVDLCVEGLVGPAGISRHGETIYAMVRTKPHQQEPSQRDRMLGRSHY